MCDCVYNQDGTFTMCEVCVDLWKDLISGKYISIDKEEYNELQELYNKVLNVVLKVRTKDGKTDVSILDPVVLKLTKRYKDPF